MKATLRFVVFTILLSLSILLFTATSTADSLRVESTTAIAPATVQLVRTPNLMLDAVRLISDDNDTTFAIAGYYHQCINVPFAIQGAELLLKGDTAVVVPLSQMGYDTHREGVCKGELFAYELPYDFRDYVDATEPFAIAIIGRKQTMVIEITPMGEDAIRRAFEWGFKL
jgi:hypothetical protein